MLSACFFLIGVRFQNRQKSALGDGHGSDHLHPLLSLLLLFQKLPFAGDIPSVTLCRHILSERLMVSRAMIWPPIAP